MRWLLCLQLGLLPGMVLPASADNPALLAASPADTQRAFELLDKLSHPSYKVRDQAQRELRSMGRLALKALEQGKQSPNTEIRLRSEFLLPEAEAAELKARIDAFLADTEEKYDHDLAGWAKFRLLAGDRPTTRLLYAEIIRRPQNHALLLAMKEIPQRLLEPLASVTGGLAFPHPEAPVAATFRTALDSHRAAIYAENMEALPNGGIRQKVPPVADHALLLLAESLISERELRPNQINNQAMSWLYQPQLKEAAMGNGPYKESYRQLVINWIETRDGLQSLSNAMNVAQFLQLGTPTLGRIAGRLLTLEGNQPWTKANALTLIARHKSTEQYPLLRQFFTDDTLVVRGAVNNPIPDILVKDVALAMALNVTGQDAKEYGFELQHSQEAMRYNYTNFRFRDEDKQTAEQKRSRAFAKWYEWESTQLGSVVSPALAQSIIPKK